MAKKKAMTADHWHEAMHACHMVSHTFERFVQEHAAVQSDDALRRDADTIADQIEALYQQLGARMAEAPEKGGSAR